MNKITNNYELEWNVILIEISYSPNYFGDITAHLDIKKFHQKSRNFPLQVAVIILIFCKIQKCKTLIAQ